MEHKLTCYLVVQTLALVHSSRDTTGSLLEAQSMTSNFSAGLDLETQCKLHCPLQRALGLKRFALREQ
ncbi:hypothetical protein O3M35_003596 [Rhynocoris fuscipes]|uniref:Secreted protein n=1 Tax=Rhynocoris fuscipes TaxID=488301 RepID=A0AAW1CKK2_9HEMI